MFKFLKSKKGVTLLEGLISLMLLALVATGTFGVLLSISRKSTSPDIREEMALAIDRANNLLQTYIMPEEVVVADAYCYKDLTGTEHCPSTTNFWKQGLCGDDSSPLNTSLSHNIACLLPPICDVNNSEFFYYVGMGDSNPSVMPRKADLLKEKDAAGADLSKPSAYVEDGKELLFLEFHIKCNGYTL